VKVPCESRKKPETCAGENESDFSKILESAPESRENGEIFLRPRHTIYRGGGGTFKNVPRFDRCDIYGGPVSTLAFRG
jgi:hypothetical protein